jgi:hypothetical protein
LGQTARGQVRGPRTPLAQMSSHRRRNATLTTPVHRRNVVSLLLSCLAHHRGEESIPQGVPTGQQVKEEGESEGRAVMVRIGVATSPRRESGQTFLWSGVTREPGQQTSGGDADMSQAVMLAGAAPNRGDAACLLPASIVKVSSGKRRQSASGRGDSPVVQFAGLGVSNSPTADREATAHQRRTGSDGLPREGDRLPSAATAKAVAGGTAFREGRLTRLEPYEAQSFTYGS